MLSMMVCCMAIPRAIRNCSRASKRKGTAYQASHPVVKDTICWGGLDGRYIRAMPDPRHQITAQDLLFAATALRAQAVRSAEDAMRPEYGSTREVFSRSAASQRELAEKFQRIGEQIGPGARK